MCSEVALDENAAMIADSIQLAGERMKKEDFFCFRTSSLSLLDFLGGEKDKRNSKVATKLSAIIKPRLLVRNVRNPRI